MLGRISGYEFSKMKFQRVNVPRMHFIIFWFLGWIFGAWVFPGPRDEFSGHIWICYIYSIFLNSMLIWNLLLLFVVVLLLLLILILIHYFFCSSRLTMESNIPYIEIIPENSDVVTGTDVTNEETSFSGMYTLCWF